jgi:hypothetical protein
MVVATVGAKEGSVEYWKRAVAVEPSGLTVPWSVAPVPELARTAAPVLTTEEAGVRRSSSISKNGRTRRETGARRIVAEGDQRR